MKAMPNPSSTAATPHVSPFADRRWLAAVFLVFAVGVFLRLHPSANFTGIGFDENLYRAYVTMLSKVGISQYPQIVENYIEYQKTLTGSILPPMRFLYIGTSALWHKVSGAEVLEALHQVACFFNVLTLVTAFGFTLRLAGKAAALGVLALMTCAPMQLHMSQHALVDGFFAFWALTTLWVFWENLRAPRHPALLAALGVCLALMVTTKENAAFVFIALCGILIANRWLRFGTVTVPLLAVMAAGPALGVLVLILLAGSPATLLQTYQLSVSKNFFLEYAIRTGDGPWFRYLVDLMLASPVVLVLAIGEMFQLRRSKTAQLYVTLFIAGSYLIMCNLKYGMNLRYANMWDMPLRFLAFTQLSTIAAHFGAWRTRVLIVAVAALSMIELRQYVILAVDYPLYELVPEALLRALKILK